MAAKAKKPASLKVYFEGLEASPKASVKKSKAAALTTESNALPPGAVRGFRPVAALPQAPVLTNDIPMYMIFAHSAICNPHKPCFKEDPRPPFVVPLDTYLLSFAQPDETFCSDTGSILRNKQLIRDYFHLHSVSDIATEPGVGVRVFSSFNGVLRAASTTEHPTQYPNIVFSFKPEPGEEDHNPNGVYRITSETKIRDISNNNSILNDNARTNWFLEDIIREVYVATGESKGIFILAGCLLSSTNPVDQKSLDDAAMMMGYANSIYNTLFQTYTKHEARSGRYRVFTNEGITQPITRMEPVSIMPEYENFRKLPLTMHPDNLAAMRGLYPSKSRRGPKGAKAKRKGTKKNSKA